MKRIIIPVIVLLLLAAPVRGRVSLGSLTGAPQTELIVYGRENLALVREKHRVSLAEGINRLRFQWQNSRVDPTSLRLSLSDGQSRFAVKELTFPAGENKTSTWKIQAEKPGTAELVISYFSLGLDWSASYRGRLTPGEETMRLEGRVKLTNGSGRNFDSAAVNLLLGEIEILDRISHNIKRWERRRDGNGKKKTAARPRAARTQSYAEEADEHSRLLGQARNQMKAAASGEHYLLEVKGRRDLKSGRTRELTFLEPVKVPIRNLFKYHPSKYGRKTTRFLEFENRKQSNLGRLPLPAGKIRLVRKTSRSFLEPLGETSLDYVPTGSTGRVKLGEARKVQVKATTLNKQSRSHSFDKLGRLSGWEKLETVQINLANYRKLPARLEIYRKFPDSFWQLEEADLKPRRESARLLSFKLELAAQSTRTTRYRVIRSLGSLRD